VIAQMRLSRPKRAFRLLFALVGGCATTGAGFASTTTAATPVSFQWQSMDSVSGTMNAVLSNGKTYSGQFLEVTTHMTVDNLWPLWSGWGPRYRGSLVIHHTGQVVANLGAPNGEHMRCEFQLVHPSDGMVGGGRGWCRMSNGKFIDATFPLA